MCILCFMCSLDPVSSRHHASWCQLQTMQVCKVWLMCHVSVKGSKVVRACALIWSDVLPRVLGSGAPFPTEKRRGKTTPLKKRMEIYVVWSIFMIQKDKDRWNEEKEGVKAQAWAAVWAARATPLFIWKEVSISDGPQVCTEPISEVPCNI